MVKYIIKRVLYSALILLIVSMLLYLLVRCLPIDFVENHFFAQANAGQISREEFDRIKALYGLEDSSFLGICRGYWKWLTAVFHGDLGTSFKYNMPVTEAISRNMWVSFGIALAAFILQYAISIPLGIKAATHQYGAVDYTTTVFAMIGISFPSFFIAILLIKVFAIDLGWFPIQGLQDANFTGSGIELFFNQLWHIVLPMLAITIVSIGGLMRHTRTNTLEVLNQDYIRTARAKGLSERTVIYKHVFRNTMVPIVTMMAGVIPSLFGGMMILEQVFALPGIGQMAYGALKEGDIPFIMGYNMFIAILTVIGTLLSDITYMIVDPRIKITK
ncbi:MAG TPA: ABC transporter permease [Firmicutes bacterium]|nr:ABC transporter permease [Bacillota bacterium]